MEGGGLSAKGESTVASRDFDSKHAHLLTRVNIQLCRDCRRFYVITYEKNEKGEAVETGYELDIRVTSSGIIRPPAGDWETIETSPHSLQKREEARGELSCF